MTEEEWERHRRLAILAAFETGRPVFADSDGRFEISYNQPAPPQPTVAPKPSWWTRLKGWLS